MATKDLTSLYLEIESALNMTEVQRILLLLDQDKSNFDQILDQWNDEKEKLSLLDKINPFSKREQKGEILRIQSQLDDILDVFRADRQILVNMTAKAIYTIPAFHAKERMNELSAAIESISAGGNMISGRRAAQKKREKLNISLIDVYGDLYKDCPKLDDLIREFIGYLFEPFHIPTELKR